MASDVAAAAGDEDREKPRGAAPQPPPSQQGEGQPGFFHIYKPGQGYWTRMGTAGGALLIVALFINFLYGEMPTWLRPMFDHSDQLTDPAARSAAVTHAMAMANRVTIGTCGAILLAYALIVFWMMNKPSNADFLIATDSEMKKVNWTSKKELWGSTKVVILFMFLIAAMLFGFDIIFGYLFYFMGVLKSSPF